MFVCHDKRWHGRNPAQCRVVEGIMHVCLYFMKKVAQNTVPDGGGSTHACMFEYCKIVMAQIMYIQYHDMDRNQVLY